VVRLGEQQQAGGLDATCGDDELFGFLPVLAVGSCVLGGGIASASWASRWTGARSMIVAPASSPRST